MRPEIEQIARDKLLQKKAELSERLARIKDDMKRGYEADSEERAIEIEDAEVVDAIGIETQRELQLINSALRRLDDGRFGVCRTCGEAIADKRLEAQPFADECIDCAEYDEHAASRPSHH